MPRRGGSSSSSRSSSRSASPSMAAPRRAAPTPTPTQAAPATGGMGSGILGGIMQGMTFGAGSEVGHQMVRGMFGGSSSHEPVAVQQQEPATQASQGGMVCQTENDLFINCLKNNGNSISFCQSYFDLLKSCEAQK